MRLKRALVVVKGCMARRTALITGAASGIGRSIAGRLAARGLQVAVLDIDPNGAARAAAEIGAGAVSLAADVADEAAVRAAVERVHTALGPVHVLVNVAGIAGFAPLVEMRRADWDRMLAVHLTGTFTCTRAVVPDMLAAGWGRIVNTGSVAGLSGGGPGLSHYAAAKGGVIAFTKALAHELGPAGITVNCIAPGLIDTPLIRSSMVSDEIRQRAIEGAPVRRIGVPDDVAAACEFLVSEESGFFTGQVVSPNGGRYM
jgi:NAD(P)-dependent dehydrogenase (short-subunit alcohol dehydrogenase family)